MPDAKMRRPFIIGASILVLLLVVTVFGLTELNLPFIQPSGSSEIILLFVVSTVVVLGLLVFGFILFRSLLKLYLERRANQLGSKFKTKLVCGALGLSVIPVCFLFLFSYSLINRTLDKWFSRPFETMSQDAHDVVASLDQFARRSAQAAAARIASEMSASAADPKRGRNELQRQLSAMSLGALDYVGVVDPARHIVAEKSTDRSLAGLPIRFASGLGLVERETGASKLLAFNGTTYVMARSLLPMDGGQSGIVWVAIRLPANISESAARLNQESVAYGALSRERKSLRKLYISILLLLTIMILFIATWFALFLSRQITIPIQALAQATQEVSRGNLDYRVRIQAVDELGTLVRSFNEMTGQLGSARSAVEESRSNLQQMNLELAQRSRFTEAILESIPTGVISVSGKGVILGANSAARRLFGPSVNRAGSLASLFGRDDARELDYLMKRAMRIGQASRPMEVRFDGRSMNLAVTVSALPGEPPEQTSPVPAGGPNSGLGGGPSAGQRAGQSVGWFVVVLEDLSELLRAQKQAAWGEVAQRVAHEIKNPLTPIALSVERVRHWLEKKPGGELSDTGADFERVVEESCSLIRQEVENLKRLVDEFSQFARFPKALPSPGNLNQIVESALGSFNGRLDGIHIETRLASDLPAVPLDSDQFRRVLVNLIDNAAEAMESSWVKELMISTRLDREREVIEAEISDTGCGVSAEDREKLFLPYFSTKDRGTGLGLAIVSRIVTEHNGAIRVEENHPAGTRFIIELPLAS